MISINHRTFNHSRSFDRNFNHEVHFITFCHSIGICCKLTIFPSFFVNIDWRFCSLKALTYAEADPEPEASALAEGQHWLFDLLINIFRRIVKFTLFRKYYFTEHLFVWWIVFHENIDERDNALIFIAFSSTFNDLKKNI